MWYDTKYCTKKVLDLSYCGTYSTTVQCIIDSTIILILGVSYPWPNWISVRRKKFLNSCLVYVIVRVVLAQWIQKKKKKKKRLDAKEDFVFEFLVELDRYFVFDGWGGGSYSLFVRILFVNYVAYLRRDYLSMVWPIRIRNSKARNISLKLWA